MNCVVAPARWLARSVLSSTLLFGSSCEPFDVVIANREPSSSFGGGAGSGGAFPHDPGSCTPPSLPVLENGRITGAVCSRAYSARVFSRGLCTCGDTGIFDLTTNGFDSRTEVAPGAFGGPVGVNGGYTALASAVRVGSDLTIAGDHELRALLSVEAAGDLRVAGNVSVTGRLNVGRDAWIDGSLTVPVGEIGRDLYVPPSAEVTGIVTVDGLTQRTDVVVDPPCPCGDDQLLDVAGVIAHARSNNDNALLGFSADALNGTRAEVVELVCGRYFVGTVDVNGPTELRVSGRAALFVDEDFVKSDDLSIVLDEGAELDLFIGGDLILRGAPEFSGTTRPGAARVYVADDVEFPLAATWVGGLYAPHASVDVAGTLGAYGALFLRGLAAAAAEVHHDAALTAGCDEPM